LALTGELRGYASPDADSWVTPSGISISVAGPSVTVDWINPPIDNDTAFARMTDEVEDRLGAQFLHTGVYAGVTWGMATIRTGPTTTASVLVNAMIAAAEKVPLSSLPDLSNAGDSHPEFRTALGLVREAAGAPDPRPTLAIAHEALRKAQGGDKQLALFIGEPDSYVDDFRASLQSGRHFTTTAPAKLTPNECLNRARAILSTYASRL
jgi:hypothetical protein